ncbi:hypothetical protein [Microbacterium sp. 77mftsu3.1]|uniref:hypothetical protein n=1 Tax=Microbacterium sp. 77mftsu3.1 TaxID=1761802 RepID=UPI000367BF88|nr:hypothetical protein [Microbacterium sp. 77mftsu3.1]SDH37581.1 hypothetical protein SAMN04488590_3171 [Microbacterium sp. 77mftsu3.1]
MTSSTARLLLLRLVGVLAQGFLLVAGTILFVFGMLDLFVPLAFIALALAWAVFRPATARALARSEYDEHRLIDLDPEGSPARGAERLNSEQYARLRSASLRRRVRRDRSLPRDRFDTTAAVATTIVWLSYASFTASVAATAAITAVTR